MMQYKRAWWLRNRVWHTEIDRETWNIVVANLRNLMFEIMQSDIEGYIKKYLHNWKKSEQPEELLYLVWQSFYFCLKKYRNFEVPLPYYFFTFTRYFLLIHYGKKEQVFLPLDDLKDILSVESTVGNETFIKLLNIQDYREHLPKKYQEVFDDAFQSLHIATQHRHTGWDSENGLSRQVYYAMKQVFKETILFLIK